MPWIAGADGCKGGWVVAILREGAPGVRLQVVPSFLDVVSLAGPSPVIAVDMPIGLPTAAIPRRACDAEARRLLGLRRSSVFSPPVREIVSIPAYSTANETSKRLAGMGLSKQAFFLMPKIREVEAVVLANPSFVIRESHPELAFLAMNGGTPLAAGKRTLHGQSLRRALLIREFGRAVAEQAAIPRGAARDDVYDALACLWTARRIARDAACIIPPLPPRDPTGLPMEIVY
jgi:predicted RNase H-like nuclease